MDKAILVIFGEDLPKKNKKWFEQFDEIITPKALEKFVSPGSVQKACELINQVSQLTLSDGSRVSKSINYQGYELWWMNYDNIYKNFCLPYTQYRNLLLYIKDFGKVYLYQSPCPFLFRYFLKVHNRHCIVFSKFRLRNLLPVPFGIFIQLLLSLGFLLWLRFIRPGLMLRTGDKFASSGDYDFRMKFIYEELRRRKIPIVEFVRSLESWSTVLRHAWQRKRPVVYSTAIISFIYSLTDLLSKKKVPDPGQDFWLLVATHYLGNLRGTIWSIRAMKFILRWIGVRAAISYSGTSRIFHEVLGCKLAGIKTVGIQHGLTPRYYPVAEFMPGFTGELSLSADKYGLWSEWWRSYYIQHSRIYKPEQLYVSGHMRPIERGRGHTAPENKKRKLAVLFISEQLAAPKEVMPYLSTFLEINDFDLYLKFRPYRDGFEEWLKQGRPEILKKIEERAKILRGTMQEAISRCDVAVGSHSTAVLESLLLLKPFVFFWTNKWGDYYDIKSFDIQGRFFAENPRELINCIRKSVDAPKEDLKRLQERFFGDPHKNGSKWAVEQALEFAKNYARQWKSQ